MPGGETNEAVSGEQGKETRSRLPIFEAEGRKRLDHGRPNLGGVSLEDHRIEMEGIKNELLLPPIAGDSGAQGGTGEGNISGSAGDLERDSCSSGNQASKGPQLHFSLDGGGIAYRAKPVLIVKDFGEPNGGQAVGGGGGGQGRLHSRTVIVAGMCQRRVPVVCLYDSLSLPSG